MCLWRLKAWGALLGPALKGPIAMSSFLHGAGRAVEGFPCQALFQGNSCRATSFPGAAILVWPFSGPHRNGWEAAEAPHGPGFPGAVHIPVAHCSALDQSKVRGAWGVTREAKSCGGFGSCLIPASSWTRNSQGLVPGCIPCPACAHSLPLSGAPCL